MFSYCKENLKVGDVVEFEHWDGKTYTGVVTHTEWRDFERGTVGEELGLKYFRAEVEFECEIKGEKFKTHTALFNYDKANERWER